MQFWQRNEKAWRQAVADQMPANRVMREYDTWVREMASAAGQRAKPVFVAYPAGYDWTFVYWYLIRFVGESPFGFQALDMKSFAMAVLGTEFRKTTKRRFPKPWKNGGEHSHVAVQDAIEQGRIFVKMLAEARKRFSCKNRRSSP